MPRHVARSRAVLVGILLLFFLSGACALTYEVVWMRMLTLVFGATTFATSTILASFFAGLALGGAYFGRVIDRGRHPLLVYAALEAGIGLCAFLMPWVFEGLTVVYIEVARLFGIGYYGLSLTRFAFSFLALMVPATLMGGTLPVMVKFFATDRERLGQRVAWLYSTNTLGAVVGAIAAGFFLILWMGVRETAYAAGVVNLLIAGVIFAIYRRSAGHPEAAQSRGPAELDSLGVDSVDLDPVEDAASAAPPSATLYPPPVTRIVLIAIGASGLCALALEVLWTRSLVFFLDNSTHAFTTILTAFLLGIGLGSLLIARATDRMERLVASLGVIEVLIGVTAILAIPLVASVPSVFEIMAGTTVDSTLPWRWMGMRFLNVLVVILVPTLLMGMAFPLAAKIYATRLDSLGTSLGNLYAVNTLGGVMGSLLAGFVLIPLIGVQNGIALVAALNVVIGIALIMVDPGLGARVKSMALISTVLLFGAVGTYAHTHGQATMTSYYEEVEDPEVLSYQEGIGATVKVYRDAFGNRTISVNGFPVAGTEVTMQEAQKSLAHLPLLVSNVSKPRVKVIGFGAGGTSWGMSRYDVERIDVVELVPAVPAQADFFPEINHGVMDDPRFNLILGDGRNHSLISEDEYDVISVDATSPKMAGNGSLYSLEFYELLAGNLSEDGVVVQWIPYHLLSDREVRMIAKTFAEVFPHATLWYTHYRQYFIIMGTQQPLRIDYMELARKLSTPEVQEDLAPLLVSDPMDVLSLFVMGEEKLTEWVADADINSDNHPYLEFMPAMAYFVSDMYRIQHNYNAWEARESVLPYLANLGGTQIERDAIAERVSRRYEASQHSILGDMLLSLGERDQARAEFLKAIQIDPTEKNYVDWIRNQAATRRPSR